MSTPRTLTETIVHHADRADDVFNLTEQDLFDYGLTRAAAMQEAQTHALVALVHLLIRQDDDLVDSWQRYQATGVL